MRRKNFPNLRYHHPVTDITVYSKQFKSASVVEADRETEWIKKAALLDDLVARNHNSILLWSTATPEHFLYVSGMDRLLGYDASLYTNENGVAFSFSNAHPQYLQACYLMNQMIFNYMVNNQITPGDKIVGSMDFLYKKADGTYTHLIQQVTLLEVDGTGQPLLVLSFVADISHIKKAGSCNLVIVHNNKAVISGYNFNQKILEEISPFSEQEKNILRLLGQGPTTKDIAKQVNTSVHTVDTHRRNLIKKTNCIDSTAVVTYARMTGLL